MPLNVTRPTSIAAGINFSTQPGIIYQSFFLTHQSNTHCCGVYSIGCQQSSTLSPQMVKANIDQLKAELLRYFKLANGKCLMFTFAKRPKAKRYAYCQWFYDYLIELGAQPVTKFINNNHGNEVTILHLLTKDL